MGLNDFHKSIGLASIVESKRKMNRLLRLASFSPDFLFEAEKDKKGRIYFDRYKLLGSGFGICVHGYRKMRINKEGKPVEKHMVTDWGVFAQGHEDNQVSYVFVDNDADQVAYCFAEDKTSGNAFEFRIANSLEVLNTYKKLDNSDHVTLFEGNISKVNVAMLMIFGTVLLPVAKNEEAKKFRDKEEAIQKELMARARLGDAEAEQSLHNMAKEQEIDLRERLAHEDLLSVFEGYFLNLVEQSGIFSILADIVNVEQLTNEASGEKLYRLTVMITGTKITLYINEDDLIGMPSSGMRIMGLGLLQGSVLF